MCVSGPMLQGTEHLLAALYRRRRVVWMAAACTCCKSGLHHVMCVCDQSRLVGTVVGFFFLCLTNHMSIRHMRYASQVIAACEKWLQGLNLPRRTETAMLHRSEKLCDKHEVVAPTVMQHIYCNFVCK